MKKVPPLHGVRVFEAVARNMSFTAAAAELNITTTAVSHQIRQLEEFIGTKLFHRNSRAIRLSQVAERLYPGIQEGLDKIADAFSELEERKSTELLTVTTTRSFAENWLLPRIKRFYVLYPALVVNVDATDMVLDMRAGDADLAIRYGRAGPDSPQSVGMFEDQYLAVCHHSIWPYGGAPQLPELRRYPLLGYRWINQSLKGPSWANWLDLAGLCKSDFRVGWLSEEGLAIQAMTHGHGPLLCSDVLLQDRLQDGTCLQIAGPRLPGLSYRLLIAPSAARKKAVQQFRDWLQGEIAEFVRHRSCQANAAEGR
jgi:LysR family glycine cleavage system transcriptional activator